MEKDKTKVTEINDKLLELLLAKEELFGELVEVVEAAKKGCLRKSIYETCDTCITDFCGACISIDVLAKVEALK